MNNELVKIENNEIVLNQDYVEQYKQFVKLKEEIELKDKEVKQAIKDFMEETGKEKIVVNGLIATIRKATTRTSLDSTKLKKELPDIYEEYSKTTNVASSLILSVAD